MTPVKTTIRGVRSYRRTAKKITLDDVWAIIHELGQANKETEAAQKEAQRIVSNLGNTLEENQQIIRDLGIRLKETQRIVGDLGNKFGDEAEHTLVPGLLEKFKQIGFNFGVLNPNRKVKDDEHNIRTEVDAFLENGMQTMAVEVKAKLQIADVDTHIERMEKLRRYADLHGDKRDLFGAMAATVVSERERDYALEKGFYVIEPSGEDVKITKPDIEWHLSLLA
jgi:hypothetical protein